MSEIRKEIASKIFREVFVPLYPKDKPLSEMTGYENSVYRQCLQIVNLAVPEFLSLILSGRPKKKECVCDAMTLDAWGCDCGARVFNIACDEYDNWIKEVLK